MPDTDAYAPGTKCLGLSLRTPASPCKADATFRLTDPDDGEPVGVTCDQHIATLLTDAGWDRPLLIERIEQDEDEDEPGAERDVI